MTIKALFIAITLSFTVTNTSTDVKADVPVGELFEAIQLAKEGFELLAPLVKPVIEDTAHGIVRFTHKRKQQWGKHRAEKNAKRNSAYVIPTDGLPDLDLNTFKATTKATTVDLDDTQDTVIIKHSKSVPTELAEEAKIAKPARLFRSRSMPADLSELSL